MPYLTIWDLISQNLAHLEANSHKNFQISQNFQTILEHSLWRNKHTTHFVVFITSFIHSNNSFWLFWGSFKVIFLKISQNFIKSPLRICLISQISVHSLWHVWYSKLSTKWNKLKSARTGIYFQMQLHSHSFSMISYMCSRERQLLAFKFLATVKSIWAMTWQNQQNECAPSKVSDQPGYLPSLIRVFAGWLRT